MTEVQTPKYRNSWQVIGKLETGQLFADAPKASNQMMAEYWATKNLHYVLLGRKIKLDAQILSCKRIVER